LDQKVGASFACAGGSVAHTACESLAGSLPASQVYFECDFGDLGRAGFLATYVAWFVNVTFEKSVMFMVAWPLIGILLALLGCGISLAVGGEDRKKLFIANALLLILAVASIIAPN